MVRDIATGSITWTPAQGLCIIEDIEATQLDVGDGVGSIDEDLECNVGELSVEPIERKSHKRAVQSSMRQARGKREKKLTEGAKLSMQLDRLLSAIESRSAATYLAKEFDPYKEIIKMMNTILEIVQDRKIYFFALSHFAEKKDHRQIFMNLNGDDVKVEWLKYEFEKRNQH